MGLLGELSTITLARSLTAVSTIRSTSNSKPAPSGTGTYRPPSTPVRRRYNENVGDGATTASPGPSTTERVAWISSLEPLPTMTPSATHP